MAQTIEAGQLNIVVDGSTYLLLNNVSFGLTSESEVSELKGTGTTIAPVQTIYSWQRSTTTTVTMGMQYLNRRVSDFLEFGIVKRQSQTLSVPGYKHVTTATSGTTTVTLPTGAVAKSCVYYKTGEEHLEVTSAQFNVTDPDAPVISGHLGKDLLVIYTIDVTGEVAAEDLPADHKPVSAVFSCNGKLLSANGDYEYIEIPAMTLTKKPDQSLVTDGDPEAVEIEFSVLSSSGTPYRKLLLDEAGRTKLGL